MITAISVILYFVALFFGVVFGDQLADQPKNRGTALFFLSLSLIFFTLAACLQIFG